MARRHRDLSTSNLHHVTNRGVDGQDIFGTDDDRRIFERFIGESADRYALNVEAYALMSNHFHLLIDRSRCDDVSGAMRQLQSGYSTWFNHRTGRSGPLFGGRFFSKPVEDDSQYLQTARYIHRNPIVIVGPSGLADYRWSSLPAYLGVGADVTWLRTERLAAMITRSRYLANVLDVEVRDIVPEWPLRPLRRTTLDRLDDAISSLALPRACADEIWAALAVELRLNDVVALADRQKISPRTLRHRAQRFKSACASQQRLAELRCQVLGSL